MKKMKKKLMTLITAVMTMVMVLSTGITTNAAGAQFKAGLIPTAVTPGGVIVYGCYYEESIFPEYTANFPQEYLLAIDAAGITNEMSDYEKCVRINDYLCATVEYGMPDMTVTIPFAVGDEITLEQLFAGLSQVSQGGTSGLDLIRGGKGVCSHYADAFQTMTSMLGIESISMNSLSLNHAWNAVFIDDITYFVDVTWNDSLNDNRYLMSTELWSDHEAEDLALGSKIYDCEFIDVY